jgi:hypothetical protein
MVTQSVVTVAIKAATAEDLLHNDDRERAAPGTALPDTQGPRGP